MSAHGIELRPYQSRTVEAIRAAWDAGQRAVLCVLPTGGGKTEVALSIALGEATHRNRILVITERKTLCGQWGTRIRRHGFDNVGILQADNTRMTWAPVLVATAQTLAARGIPEDVGLVIVDESQIWHQTHDRVLATLSGARVLGLTATPLRNGLGLRFDKLVVGATIRELIDGGYLVPARYYAPRYEAIESALDDVAVRAGDFATNPLSAAMRAKAIMGDVVRTWIERGEDRQTIAFCVDKEHARQLAGEFREAGITAEPILDDTDDDTRARLLSAFDARGLRVLVSVGVLSVGFDSPVASCAILARPTLSLSLHVQQGGRVLRPFEGKRDALILDHAGNTLRHGLLEDFQPPTELSEAADRKADRKKRHDPAQAWLCRNCEAINSYANPICAECGEPRCRRTVHVVLDGQLVPVEVARDDDPLPGPTMEDVRAFYRMAAWHGSEHGLNQGWAFYATASRFHFDTTTAKRIIRWSWRDLEPVPPDFEARRWFRASYQRQLMARRFRGE
ncbi:DEAD/DEAH box helicase [Cupriavidus oxalaticus]|uniref:DEAD/DEAH box helicase n=1 Tax=Cupriavidus oxalaticus TaxID=96344 RepID=A0A5P3VSF8_9BURK|nr:DEAD/DEAH box helicase [Cupriavidus oxalaticus]QEZ48948.1 DEAD/DEAH box helicase [Cupriavidus oxalaticus]